MKYKKWRIERPKLEHAKYIRITTLGQKTSYVTASNGALRSKGQNYLYRYCIHSRSPIHKGRKCTHTHTRVRGRILPASHCNINSNVMKLHSEIVFNLLQNNIND